MASLDLICCLVQIVCAQKGRSSVPESLRAAGALSAFLRVSQVLDKGEHSHLESVVPALAEDSGRRSDLSSDSGLAEEDFEVSGDIVAAVIVASDCERLAVAVAAENGLEHAAEDSRMVVAVAEEWFAESSAVVLVSHKDLAYALASGLQSQTC